MKNNKSKRVWVFAGVVASAFFTFLIIYYQNNNVQSLEARAEQRAQMLGQKLIEQHFEQRTFLPDQMTQERGLASNGGSSVVRKNLNGEVGRDPWGQPFYFQVKGDGISNSTLYIWSVGSDGAPNFKDVKDLIATGVRGDDILVSIPF